MNVYEEIRWIAELNEMRNQMTSRVAEYLYDINGLDFDKAYLVRGCTEANGHLYHADGCQLDNSGLVDCDYYCTQYTGYCEDYFYGTLYFGTNEKGVFVAVPFEC